MESFHAQLAVAALGVPDDPQIAVIWQMGLASLSSNNNELLLPPEMALQLSSVVVNELKLRLSRYLGGAPTLAFFDHEQQVFRIRQVPELLGTGEKGVPVLSSEPTAKPCKSPTPGESTLKVRKTRNLVKKIPRPPNAFILYRKDNHPVLKKEDPSIHNNKISIILGKKWQAEPETVKEHYKGMAEKLKRKHAAENPGYQYAPRKPSEKKRRMTSRKMAQLQAGVQGQPQEKFHVAHISNYEQDLSRAFPMLDMSCGIQEFIFPPRSPKTAEHLLKIRRPAVTSHLEPTEDQHIAVTMPSKSKGHLSEEAQTLSKQCGQQSRRAFDPEDDHITSRLATHVINDQDFFDSLVDWEAIAADAALVKSATTEEMAELADVELGNPYLLLSEEGQRTAFEKELDRTMRFFKS